MEPEVGLFYNGIVKKIVEIGAFVEILPGTDGLLHISRGREGAHPRRRGRAVRGRRGHRKCIKVDRDGKIRLSRREASTRTRRPKKCTTT